MNKQIEEQVKEIREISKAIQVTGLGEHLCDAIAVSVYDAGYRRQDEVAKEIFAEIEQAILAHGTNYAMKRLAELKKKYEVTEE